MGVQRIRLNVKGDGALLIEQREEHAAEGLIVDAAAGSSQVLLDLEDDIGLLSETPQMGYSITVVSILSRIKNPINLLKATLAMTNGFDGQHVAVKTLYFGTPERCRLFNGSKTQTQLLKQGSTVRDMSPCLTIPMST